jgi:inner membrane transporter RhtA
MSRLPRPTFALLLALLPACATAIGVLVLRQIPTLPEVLGVALIVAGVAIHQEPLPQAGNASPAARQAAPSAAQSELPVA